MSIRNNLILLVDDEKYTLEFLSYSLSKHGFKVETASSGAEAVELAQKMLPSVIVLDVMMPDMDGIETCIELRKITKLRDTAIAFLTGRVEDYTQIIGFEAGADDFIKKPIRLNVLVQRIKAIQKRLNRKASSNIIEVKNVKLILEKFQVVIDNDMITMPKREFELLTLLAQNPQKVFTREEIFSKIWGYDTMISDRTVNVHISRIRAKLKANIIKTVKGVGYSIQV
ncbi:MAG TPA: response regulator transcription factor [Bacteroidales bacterium]|nr:response regulator transcription factor [Bacteroidales bacterium]HRX98260.1 response regulator transcription factor [Bacteroidales bacterium]